MRLYKDRNLERMVSEYSRNEGYLLSLWVAGGGGEGGGDRKTR